MTDRKSRPPINARFPLLVVRREYFDQFAAGTKTIEYRLHRPPFTQRVYYPGRWIKIAYNYNITKNPTLLACVIKFDLAPARDYPAMLKLYPDLKPDAELALIKLYVRRESLISIYPGGWIRPFGRNQMQMAKVFKPEDRSGWYYMCDLNKPVGPFRTKREATAACRATRVEITGVFKFMVPVFVTMVDGHVSEVHVADETDVRVADCELIEKSSAQVADADALHALVRAANNGQDWPSWEFGW